jgi:ribosomal protein S27AE
MIISNVCINCYAPLYFALTQNKGILPKRNMNLPIDYWIIADASTHERIRACKECGTVFFAHDERQEFCPAIYTKESPCSKKHRMKRLREK